MTTDAASESPGFDKLGLDERILEAVQALGYESPSPIQAKTIPHLLAGKDLVGQAQTGTGKTGAFALPLLSQIILEENAPQVLTLAPTRELAIQVAEAFEQYARFLPDFHVIPIYGGQEYGGQLRRLRRGVHVVVGTPGRVMDHLRRGTLKLDGLRTLVLDEADEMLRMGFIDDVEWIIEQTPDNRQIALFSATMPEQIRRIAKKHLHEPVSITIKTKTSTVETTRQRYWTVSGLHKLDALTRMLEVEPFEGMIIFVRTRIATTELTHKLAARGYAVSALNGEIPQNQRERTIDKLKKGHINIIVATDVAARGLDVERVSHVINYDVPYDVESYIHRIGRTGRAGRHGEAILFLAPREKRMLKQIERATRQKLEEMNLPTRKAVNAKRIDKFKERIQTALAEEGLEQFEEIAVGYATEHDIPIERVAAALASMAQGKQPLLLDKNSENKHQEDDFSPSRRPGMDRFSGRERGPRRERDRRPARRNDSDTDRDLGKESYRIEVGRDHGVEPGNIVGAIANEAGLDSAYIGRIDIREDHSIVDLPEGMPKEILNLLGDVWVSGQQLRLRKLAGRGGAAGGKERAFGNKPSRHKAKNFGKRKSGGSAGHRKGGKRGG